MSVSLNGTNQYLNAAASVTAYPFSVSAWMKTSDLTQNGVLVDIGATTFAASKSHNYTEFRGAVGGDPVRASTYYTAATSAASSTGVSSGTWHHVLAVYNSDTDRRVYIDGGSKGTDSGNQNGDANITVMVVGVGGNGAFNHFAGNIAEVGIWSSALSDANAVTLAGGALPTDVDSSNLEEYWSLLSDANSDGGNSATDLTGQGTPSFDSGDHPDVDSVTYVEIAGTVAAVSSLSGALDISTAVELAGTIAATTAASGTLTISNFPSGSPAVTNAKQHLVAIGNNSLYYEDS